MTQADKVITSAEKWLGYLEKKSNSCLLEMTANAGSANYTIFAERYKTRWGENYQGQPWCAVFVSDMLYEGCGKELVKHFAYCPYGVDWFRKQGRWFTSNPKRGDVIFFRDSSGVACHVGLVSSVGNGKVVTIEGNTSSASGVIANGGCVAKKSYDIGYSRILGYGRPVYEQGSDEMDILIISGHGNGDPGACGCGEEEAKLTRELALLVQDELKKIETVNPILYDREKNAFDVLKNGGSLPLDGVSYVLELHFNACVNDFIGDGKTTGTEILVHSLESGIGVEEAICRHISALGFRNRGVKKRSDLRVMNNVKKVHGISHALLETCFIDDIDDMKLYRANKENVAKAVAKGIADGFGLKYTQTAVLKQEDDAMPKTDVEKIARAAAQDVVQETFTRIYNNANPLYTSLDQVPDYWKQETREMMQCGAIQGDGVHEISIRRDTLQAAIIAHREFVR